jgi:negative regulator of flagellin synthesis FlgM
MQINGPAQVHGTQGIKPPHHQPAVKTEPTSSPSTVQGGDKLELSEAGQIAAQLADIPDVRTDRVAAIRQALADGTYETEERLNAAVDALLDEIG